MDKHQLSVSDRTISGRKVKQLRQAGLIPANIFGKKITSQNIQVDAKDFSKLYSRVVESTLIYLTTQGAKDLRPVFIKKVALDPVTGRTLHVAFLQVDLKEKVTAPVP